jgi:hypothetical protein
VEWPGRHVTGEGFRLLMDLVRREIVRVLDPRFIAKDADGRSRRSRWPPWIIPTRSMRDCWAC